MSWEVVTLLFLAGLSAGFIDAIAGGGGLISVPALLWAGLPPQMALGTNKMQSTWGTLMAVRKYAKAGLVSWPREAGFPASDILPYVADVDWQSVEGAPPAR